MSFLAANQTDLQFQFRTKSFDSLITWLGRLTSSENDHLSVGIKNGKLQVEVREVMMS